MPERRTVCSVKMVEMGGAVFDKMGEDLGVVCFKGEPEERFVVMG